MRRSVRAQDEVLIKKPYVIYGGEPAHVSPKIIYHRETCHPPVSNRHLRCWRCSALMRTTTTDGAETSQNWNDRTFYLRGVSFVTLTTRREVTYFFTGMLKSEKQSWLVNIDFYNQLKSFKMNTFKLLKKKFLIQKGISGCFPADWSFRIGKMLKGQYFVE